MLFSATSDFHKLTGKIKLKASVKNKHLNFFATIGYSDSLDSEQVKDSYEILFVGKDCKFQRCTVCIT